MSKKTQDLIQQLDEGVQKLYNSKTWKNYLQFLTRFHSYSVNNSLLIFTQRPDATLVSSMTNWNRLNGHIKKGSKSIKIIAPHTYEEEQPDGTKKQMLGFHTASVFDISDVVGVDIPESPCKLIEGNVKDYGTLIQALSDVSPVPICFKEFDGSANGYFDIEKLEIVVRDSLPEAQKIKTLLHEMAHAYLHARGAEEEKVNQSTREVQAESVAYIVSQYLEIDTADYTFGYIARWSKGKSSEILKNNIDVISKTADRIIQSLEDLQGKAAA